MTRVILPMLAGRVPSLEALRPVVSVGESLTRTQRRRGCMLRCPILVREADRGPSARRSSVGRESHHRPQCPEDPRPDVRGIGRVCAMKKARRNTCWAIAISYAVLLNGCVTHTATRGDSDTAQTMYQVSEEEAFTTILEFFAVEMPKQSVDDVVDGKYRGYNATARFWMDWTDHRVLVIPAKGTDKDGREVSGY